MDARVRNNLLFFCAFCLLIVFGLRHLDNTLKQAEVYQCYYHEPLNPTALVPIIIKPECFLAEEYNYTPTPGETCVKVGSIHTTQELE